MVFGVYGPLLIPEHCTRGICVLAREPRCGLRKLCHLKMAPHETDFEPDSKPCVKISLEARATRTNGENTTRITGEFIQLVLFYRSRNIMIDTDGVILTVS